MTTSQPTGFEYAGVRQAVRADLLDVFRIEKRSFPQPWPFSAFERYLGRPGFLVAEDTGASVGQADDDGATVGRVAGFVVADTIPNHNRPLGHIKDIAVHPNRRGQGLGRTLLERAMAVLGAQGVQSVKLEVRRSNESAIALYRDYGFEYLRTLPRYYGDGEDAFVFITRLSDHDRERERADNRE